MYKLFVICLFFIMSFPLYAQDKKQNSQAASPTDRSQLQQRVKKLKKTIESLKKNSNNTTLDVEDLELRVDDAEKAFGRNKLDFKLDFRFTINNFFYKDKTRENKDLGNIMEDGRMFNSMNLRGRLNFLGNLGKTFKLTGWLTMYKKVLQSTPDAYDNAHIYPSFDLARPHYPSDSRVYMERLYIDWFPLDWLAFSIGRIGLAGGIPADMRDDTVSLGSVPETSLNLTADALYATFKLEPLIGLKKSFLRLSWTPIAFHHTYTGYNLFEEYKNFDNANNYVANLDISIPGIPRSRFVYMLYYNDSYNVLVDFPQNPLGITGKLRSYGSLGGLLYNNFTLKIDKIFDLPFDLCLSANISTSFFGRRDGKNKGFLAEDDSNSEYVLPLMSMLGNDLTGGTATGIMLYGGFRYHTPLKIYHSAVKIGGEFIYGSKNNLTPTTPDTTDLLRYSIRGYNFEGYLTIPIHTSANIRFGYIFQKHDYSQGLAFYSGSGIPKVDEQIHNVHMMFNVYFQ